MVWSRRLLAIIGLVLLAAWTPPAPAAAAPLPQPSPCATAVAAAVSKRGSQYVWGAKGPTAFDCSGLTHWSYSQAGINIGLSTYDQATAGASIPCTLYDIAGTSTTCWQPGDLIFLRYTGGQHVAMYIGGGLFADAYNSETGVIIHDVSNDLFYWDNFWQARRVTDCAGSGEAITTPDVPETVLPPSLEELPNILAYLSFSVPQCNQCDPNGQLILPPTTWSGSWPVGFETLNLPLVFQTVISWLAWQIGEIIRQLICWLLSMLAMLASWLQAAVNAMIYGVNSLFKLGVLLWLTLRGWFLAFWLLLEELRALLAGLAGGLAGLAELGRFLLAAAALIGSIIAQLLGLLGQLALALLGLLAWIGGLVLGFWGQLQLALAGTTAPAQLAGTHPIYQATRGVLEGLIASDIGWVFPVLWGMCYVAFVVWLARFLSASQEVA